MSIIQAIREKAAPIVIVVIAISLIGFILMDAGRSGLGGGVGPNDAVADINGTKVSYASFLDKVSFNEQVYEANGRPVNDNSRQQIYAETWRSIVEGELLNQEYEKLGLVISDKEFNDLLFGKNPPEFLKQQFVNAETGEYDAVAAKQAINQLKRSQNNPTKDMLNKFYLEPLVEGSLRNKYFALIQNSLYIPKWMAEKTMADNSQQASFSYVAAPYSSISDSTVKVSDADINAYVKEHEKEYKTDENTRNISYVSFPYSPTAADTAEVLNELNNLKAEFTTTSDPAAFVTRNGSTMGYSDAYFSRNRIQIAQKDSILGSVGTVYGPYLDVRSYVMSRVVDVKNLPDSVKARHILVATVDPRSQQQVRDDSTAKKIADSLLAQIKSGVPFEILAMTRSDDEGSKSTGGDLGYFASGAMVKEFNDFAFENKKGSMDIVRTQFGYHILEVLDQKNFGPAYKVAYLAKEIEPSQNTINEALNKATLFSGNSRTAKQFADNASKQGLNVLVSEDVRENEFMVPALGVNRQLVKDIFKADVGDVLEPVDLNDQYVVVAVTGEQEAGLPSAAKVRSSVEPIVRNQLKAKQLIKTMGTPTTLEEAAQKVAGTVQRADSVSFVSPMIPGAGFELKVGGYAFNRSALNKVSKPIEGASGVYVVRPESVIAVPDPANTVQSLQTNLMNQQRGSVIYSTMEAMRKSATIKDNRAKFY